MNWRLNSDNPDLIPKLRVPVHTAIPTDPTYTDPKQLEEWISHLPLGHPLKSVRQLFEALASSNRHKIPINARLKYLERLRQPISVIRQGLEQQYRLNDASSCDIKSKNIAVLNREIHSELANAYKIIVKDAILKEEKTKKATLVTAIHRGITHLSDLIISSSMIYKSGPENTWQEIHSLYSLASNRGLENQKVVDSCKQPATNNSIKNQYLQILLYALASPYCMRHQDSRLLLSQLPEWSNLVDLQRVQPNSPQENIFVVRFASDEPPTHIDLQKKKLSNRCRLLDTAPLLTHLEQLVSKKKAANTSGCVLSRSSIKSLPTTFISYLTRAWDASSLRKDKRTSLGFDLQLAIGFPSIHILLKEGAQQKAATQKTQANGDEESLHWFETQVTSHNASPPISFDEVTTKSEASLPKTVTSRPLINQTLREQSAPWAKASQNYQIRTYSCRTVNESSGGYCMDWQGPEAPVVKVGELIGIQSSIDGNQFGIGAIRWIRHADEEKLQLGMEIISPDALAVEISDTGDQIRDCLLLPEIKAKKTGSTLIVPSLTYHTGNILQVKDEDGDHEIELADLVESSAAFERYRFNHTQPKPEKKTASTASKSEQDAEEVDFDAIWSML